MNIKSVSLFTSHYPSRITYRMYSSFGLVFLTILLFNLSSSVFAADYPITGIVLLQSAPQSEAFGTVTISQPFEGD